MSPRHHDAASVCVGLDVCLSGSSDGPGPDSELMALRSGLLVVLELEALQLVLLPLVLLH